MKKIVLPATLSLLLLLAFVFWLPREKPIVEAAKSAPTVLPTVPVVSTEQSPLLEKKLVVTSRESKLEVPASAAEDIGGEDLSETELASIASEDKQLNIVRERWAEERQKIYRRLHVTEEEERRLSEAADAYEGELQVESETGSITAEIDRELAGAARSFDQRTAEILGHERFEALLQERDKFNKKLRAEGFDTNVGSFW